ncbi:hypothetical protein [Duncaniella dubosii]|uniref:hypothetical protein n=1 Tax=Duncaniella dubosii TaxID=2518971 RepID=UPI0023F58C4D|nr:hypothetical protein [Duncaniella dubosii]MCX4285095.1 hypothetical protein [Duncaniella dubosii]
MQTISINFIVPQGWHELGDKQLRYVYDLIAKEYATDEIKTLCLLRWSGTKVIGRQESGTYLLKKSKILFEVTPLTLAELLPHLDWLSSLPTVPVRISKINRQSALPADFSEVPFETFIICDNLYQGYLSTQNDELLDQLGATLYGKDIAFKPYERISIFYWFAALKESLSKKYSDFFQPIAGASDGNLLGSSASVEDAMNAQIRALTKGDITKEAEVLALDTHRALTELNAQAREYKELNAKMQSNGK